ncbi:hypothetical protein ACQP1S_17810 [Micromonospora matsumotoense]
MAHPAFVAANDAEVVTNWAVASVVAVATRCHRCAGEVRCPVLTS